MKSVWFEGGPRSQDEQRRGRCESRGWGRGTQRMWPPPPARSRAQRLRPRSRRRTTTRRHRDSGPAAAGSGEHGPLLSQAPPLEATKAAPENQCGSLDSPERCLADPVDPVYTWEVGSRTGTASGGRGTNSPPLPSALPLDSEPDGRRGRETALRPGPLTRNVASGFEV